MPGAQDASAAAPGEPTWFGHPRGLTVLFLTEMWEKFSFFGMRVLLVYYMTKSLAFEQGKASLVYGLYTAFIYLTPVFGGWIADRYLARRRAVILGGAIMAAGHFMMAFPPLFYPALATIAAGNGLFLPTLPSQIRSLYAPADPRGTFAYSYYYVGVNLGAFLAPIVCGTLGEVHGWHWGFGAAGVGMVAGLLIYVAGHRYLPPDPREGRDSGPLPLLDADAKSRFAFLLIVAAIAMVFRSAYEQVGNTVALWADAGVDRRLGSWTIPVTWYMSINPLIVFLGTPIIVGFWARQAARTGRKVPHLRRMATGAAIVAAAYLLAAASDAWTSGRSGWPMLLAFMALLTVGELYILPVGLALFGRMAPKGFEATTLALWFLAAFAGNLAAGALGTLWSVLSHPQFYSCIAAVAAAAGAAFLVLASRNRTLATIGVVGLAMTSVARADDLPAPAKRPVIEEIIVTANRRAENVQDIASGIRVLGGEELEQAGVAGFEDYIFTIPGADLGDSGMEKKISIRGIGNVASNPGGAGGSASPIGIYLNDTPIQGNGVLPDLALYDLERIEVLKGPQGTLYGEGAQGGAIKMLLNRADPSEIFAKGELSFGETRFGGGLNHTQSAAVNSPLFGSWAVRLVGSRREDKGFVDFPERGTRDENDATNLMGRAHVDGEVGEGFDVSAMVFHQRQRLAQFPQVQKSEGDLRNRNSEPQFADTDFTLAGLTLDYDLGFAELTSSTSGFVNDRQMLSRFPYIGALAFIVTSPILGGGAQQLPGADNEWTATDNHQFSIAQELRLVSQEPARIGWLVFDWVTGAFYRTRDNEFDFLVDNDLPCCPPPVESGVVSFTGVESFEQFAGFGEVTLDLPWNLELGAGARVFRETALLDGSATLRGPLYPFAVASGEPDGTLPPKRFETATTEVTPKVSLAWFFDDARMLYALVANGVRSGGTNPNAIGSTVTPLFAPDSLWTYEIGAKTRWLDGLLTANLSVFHNDWKDLQVLTTEEATLGGIPTALSAVLNVGEAFSRGVELELAALPTDGLTLGFNVAIMEGEISQGDPAGTIPDGSPLPQLSELSYAASAGYELLDWSFFGFRPVMHFDTQRVGDRFLSPPGTLPGPELEGFQLYGAMVGLANDRWELTFVVHNLTDARPEIGANLLELETKTIGPPRTWTARCAFRW